MYSLLFLAALSFLICFFLTPLVRNFLNRADILDRPDQERKLHERPIPRLGGVPIMAAMVISLVIFSQIPLSGAQAFRGQWPMLLHLLPGATLVFLIGVLDDLFGLRPWQKLLGEVAAAGWVFWYGIRIRDVFAVSPLFSHWLSFPLTILWLVGCANAFNLIDGMDGLASGVGFFATCTMLVGALLQGWGAVLTILTAPLAGALLAFLRFNFNPASMFLGDSGSLVIGFLLGAYGILWSQKSITLLGVTAPLMALAFPILEAGVSVSRRFLRGDPIFAADRGHIHHRLVDLGLTPRRAVLLIYGVTSIFAIVSLLTSIPQFRYSGLVIILFCAVSWMGIQHLGYAEFTEARKIILSGTVRQLIASQTKLRSYRYALERAESMPECWTLTVEAMRELGFDYVEMVVPGGVRFSAWLGQGRAGCTLESCWTLKIPLGASVEEGWLQLSRQIDRGEGYLMLHAVVETVREVFPKKIPEHEQTGSPVQR
jgi:UDP-GlcNAc:undecaprenyl-phosphate GlcNAc-1-phosphate transferase